MSSEETAWLAGWLEGEGSFFLQGGKTPCIQGSCGDMDTAERAASLMGCSVVFCPDRRGHQTMCRVCKRGRPAVVIMEQIRPWMSSRRQEKIDEVVLYYRAYREQREALQDG
jgi:hypothetical protein